MNFLENSDNLSIIESNDDNQNNEEIDVNKIKISKAFKLINPLPKLKSVPATPQFFDMAGGYI